MWQRWQYYQARRTYVVAVFSVSILGGLLLAKGSSALPGWWMIIAAGLLLAAYKRSVFALVGVSLAGLLIGGVHGSEVASQLARYESLFGRMAVVQGEITDDPARSNGGQYTFHLSRLIINGRDFSGQLQVSLAHESALQRGDVVKVKGKVTPGFGSVVAKMSFADVQSITPTTNPILQVRRDFSESVHANLREPEASLGLGFVIGETANLPPDFSDNLKAVGLTHIVVASGYNLTILVRLARRLFARVSKYATAVAAVGLMGGFLLVTGFSASMTRAALVSSLALWAWYYGRRIHPLVLVLFAAALTGMLNPEYVWADVGWYLSFLSFAGVLLLAPLLQKVVLGERQASTAVQVIFETLCAQLATLPVQLLIFGKLMLLSLPANVMVVPLIPPAMVGVTVVGMVGMIGDGVAHVAAWPVEFLIDYMVRVVNWLASFDWARLSLQCSGWGVVAVVVVLLAAGVLLWRRLRFDYLQTSVIE